MMKIIYILSINFNALEVFNEKNHKNRKQIYEYFKNNFDSHEFINLEDMPLFSDGIHLDYEKHEIVASKVLNILKD